MNNKIERTHFLVRQMQTNAVVHDAAPKLGQEGTNCFVDESGHWPKVSVVTGKVEEEEDKTHSS